MGTGGRLLRSRVHDPGMDLDLPRTREQRIRIARINNQVRAAVILIYK